LINARSIIGWFSCCENTVLEYIFAIIIPSSS
jgi:hypothetical protein